MSIGGAGREGQEPECDSFKPVFKYYKSRTAAPDLTGLLHPHHNQYQQGINIICHSIKTDDRCALLGLADLLEWKLYSIDGHPGLIFISNPFTVNGQRYWSRRCLEEYPKKPNKTNLDNEINLDDWWSECNTDIAKRQYLKRLRWSTLGYHHDWDTKVYTQESYNEFPEDIAELCDVIANCLDYNQFVPQAAIVNYYNMDSTLSAHTDHSEQNLDAPLISISFGQSAVFLIGGQRKSQKPTALLLHSGDIVIMSKESRLCYHAVPRIISTNKSPWNELSRTDEIKTLPQCKYIKDPHFIQRAMKLSEDNSNWTPFDKYLQMSRININVRQVLNCK